MTVVGRSQEGELHDSTDLFWRRAPLLFELACEAGESLGRSDSVSDDLWAMVNRLADGIPQTPDAFQDLDPYLGTALLTGVIHALRSHDDRRELRISVERVRQALRDLLDERPVWRAGPKDAATWLRALGIPAKDLAEMTGVNESTIRRWASAEDDQSPSGENAIRIVMIAKIVNHLRHVMTPTGAVQWLNRPHPALDDRTPLEELKDPASYAAIIHLAARARSFVAS